MGRRSRIGLGRRHRLRRWCGGDRGSSSSSGLGTPDGRDAGRGHCTWLGGRSLDALCSKGTGGVAIDRNTGRFGSRSYPGRRRCARRAAARVFRRPLVIRIFAAATATAPFPAVATTIRAAAVTCNTVRDSSKTTSSSYPSAAAFSPTVLPRAASDAVLRGHQLPFRRLPLSLSLPRSLQPKPALAQPGSQSNSFCTGPKAFLFAGRRQRRCWRRGPTTGFVLCTYQPGRRGGGRLWAIVTASAPRVRVASADVAKARQHAETRNPSSGRTTGGPGRT